MRITAVVVALAVLMVNGLAFAAGATTQQAIAEYGRENYEEALAILGAARQTEGKSSLNDYYTGLCQKQAGDPNGAINSLKGALQGDKPEKEAVVDLIALLLNLDQLDEAAQWVAWAEKEQVKPKDVAYLKGLLLAKQKRYTDAVAQFQSAKTGVSETDQQIDLQIAVALAQSGKSKEASESLKAIVTRYPGTDVAGFAAEYDQRLSTATRVKPWNVYAGVSYLYDDNVTLKSRISGASSDTRNQRDSGVTENLRFEYDLPLAQNWSANLQYAIQNNNYFRLHDYDMLSQSLTANFIGKYDNLILAAPLNLNYSTLNYNSYSLQPTIKPTATILFNRQNLGQVSLGYSYREMFRNNDGAAYNRSANLFNLQLGYIFLFADGRGMFNLRGEGFYENTFGNEWRNAGGRVGSDLLVPVTSTTKLILTAEGAWQDYFDSSASRKDTTVVASASINQKLVDHVYLNLQYYYTRAMSNVDLYDYQRNVFMTGVELRF